MVSISHEDPTATDARLRGVIRHARIQFYDDVCAFEEFPLSEFNVRARPDAFALVRDEQVWSQLLPYAGEGEKLALFRFHFPAGVDNSGFIGWLASLLKAEFGTGAVITCGSNRLDGGIFDYWGIPDELREQGFTFVRKLAGLEAA
jgi:hypothetical protein